METKEIWKNSKTFDGIIQVSSFGNFRRKVIAVNSKGKKFVYYECDIPKRTNRVQKVIQHKGKSVYAKRLIAEVFVKGFNDKNAVELVDGDINNFHPDNLRLTQRYKGVKGKDNHLSKLKDSDILEIVELYKNKVNYKVIAEKYGIHPINVHRIARNEIWKHVKRKPILKFKHKKKSE